MITLQSAARLTADQGTRVRAIIVVKVNRKINIWPFLPFTDSRRADVLVYCALNLRRSTPAQEQFE